MNQDENSSDKLISTDLFSQNRYGAARIRISFPLVTLVTGRNHPTSTWRFLTIDQYIWTS